MLTYQTYLYSSKFISGQIGWDYDQILFSSPLFDNPTEAMLVFNENPITVEH
jgi:hypothetical protein